MRCSVDGTSVSWSDTHTQALAAGTTITLTANGGPGNLATWTATSGSHQVRAFADDIDRIPESNDGNNQLTLSVTVGGGCSANCSGNACGSDGCSGNCGTCGSGLSCNASGQCVAGSRCPAYPAMPDAACTGVIPGTALKTCDGLITSSNSTYTDCLFPNGVIVGSNVMNVQISNSKIEGVISPQTTIPTDMGLVLTDVEIDGKNADLAAWAFGRMTCVRCNVHDVARAFQYAVHGHRLVHSRPLRIRRLPQRGDPRRRR